MGTYSSSGHGGSIPDEEGRFLRENGYLRRPDFVQWMATLDCGLSCPHCLAAGAGTADMRLRDVERLLDQLAELQVRGFLITGGEPAVRQDLPEVIGALRERRQRWQINTAVMPGPRLRAAIRRHPPDFAAVSLDGPEELHDCFRGLPGAHRDALAAIRFYRRVVTGDVVAGTTVTARNYRYLSSTMDEVRRSGATAWGLHLLVPEGRAAADRGLFLSRRQLRGLIDFCAEARDDFPVGMADEIGWLGADERRVRDEPFFCGAGRTQCVVLPDGEVVPCTTLDRTTSAGNVLRQPFAEIWRDGFEALRSWRPEGKCASCEYSRACRGGCWLQRKNGTQCFKGVWQVPRLAAAAAGAALCLGLSSAVSAGESRTHPRFADIPAEKTAPKGRENDFPDVPLGGAHAVKTVLRNSGRRIWLDERILEWQAYRAAGRSEVAMANIRRAHGDKAPQDAGTCYFMRIMKSEAPLDTATRCRAVIKAAGTEEPSLSLLALMWRDLVELSLDGKSVEKRSPEERKLLCRTYAILCAREKEWRPLLLKKKFHWTDAAPVGGGGLAGVFGFKGGGGRRFVYSTHHWRRVQEKRRWPKLDGASKVPLDYWTRHPLGGHLTLSVECTDPKAQGLRLLRAGEKAHPLAKLKMRIFDLLLTPRDRQTRVSVAAGFGAMTVTLPAGCEISYGDLLRLCRDQNREKVARTALDLVGRRRGMQLRPLLLAELREMAGYAYARPVPKLNPVINKHIEDMGSDSWKEREAATEALAAIGRSALPALRKALTHKDPEIATRAELVLSEIRQPSDATRFRIVTQARSQVTNVWTF